MGEARLCGQGGGGAGGHDHTWKIFLALLVARDEYSFSSDNFLIILSQNESKM